jgi:predicted O-methyltransferase YrrM
MARLLAPWQLVRVPRAALRRLPAEAWRGAAERFWATVEAALEDPAFTQAWDELAVPGWLDRPVARLLHGLARSGPGHGDVVEVGSYLGRSTVILARGLQARGQGRLLAVDPHQGQLRRDQHPDGPLPDTWGLFLANLATAGVAEVVQPVRATSAKAAAAWQGPVRLLFIDGLHDFDSVLDDATRWHAHLTADAVVVFDDVQFGSVRRAITAARHNSLLPPCQVMVGNAAVCGMTDDRALRHYLLPRLYAAPAAGHASDGRKRRVRGHETDRPACRRNE